MMSEFTKYDECAECAKSYIESQELWIFEDRNGKFRAIQSVDGQKTFDHCVHVNSWIPHTHYYVDWWSHCK